MPTKNRSMQSILSILRMSDMQNYIKKLLLFGIEESLFYPFLIMLLIWRVTHIK